MKEDFLHYIWKNKLFISKKYLADSGEEMEILDTGIHNHDAGPDFFNAKILINGTLWAGNVEIHIRSSEWNLHSHQKDKAYNNVILHVVASHDKKSKNLDGKHVPTIVLEYPEHISKNHEDLRNNNSWISCEDKIKLTDPLLFTIWTENLAIERLQLKTKHIESILEVNENNWEESFYQILARSYGFGVNGDPFELLAKSVPLKILSRHKNSFSEIEAILFGQSGLLSLNGSKDDYTKKLVYDYNHLKNKYGLIPIEGHLWKFLRLRPGNFPTIRLAQFSSLLFNATNLLSAVIEKTDITEMTGFFRTAPSSYWTNHYLFGKTVKQSTKTMGQESVNSIIINSVVPFIYLYGKRLAKENLAEQALHLLQDIAEESNNIIVNWKRLGIEAKNSFESQALIQLKKEYCDKKKCLQCKIGHAIITRKRE